MKNQRLLLACTLGALTFTHVTGASLVDDFESYTIGRVNPGSDNATGGVWSSNGSNLPRIMGDASNKYLSYDWSTSGYRGAHRDLGTNAIGATDTSTLFFRFYSSNETGDNVIGVTDDDNPTTNGLSATPLDPTPAFNDLRAGINLVDDGSATNSTYNLQVGSTTLATGLTESTWYNTWLVIDNATNTMDVYLNNGLGKASIADKLNSTPIAFYNNTTNALDRFVAFGGLGGSNDARVDDININSGALAPALFFDDFESVAAGSNISNAGPWGSTSATAGLWTVENESVATPFGSPNQFGNLADSSASASVRIQSPNITEAVGAVTTYSFDFYEPTGGGDSNLILGYSNNNDDLNGSGSRQIINLNNGTISGLSSADDNTYDLDTAYTLYMIFNDSGSELIYDGGTLADGEAHIWLEELDSGVFVFAGTSSEQNTSTVATSYRVGFRSFSSFIQTVQVDNVELSLGAAAVPEPTSLALLGLGGLLLARRRR